MNVLWYVYKCYVCLYVNLPCHVCSPRRTEEGIELLIGSPEGFKESNQDPLESRQCSSTTVSCVKPQRSNQQFRSCPVYIFSLKSLTVKSLGESAPTNPRFFLALCWCCFTHASVLSFSSALAHCHCFSHCQGMITLVC